MKRQTLRIATRQSPLALWQANNIKSRLIALYPELKIEILGITTTGDKKLQGSLSAAGGKRLFVKELEQALLNGTADLAVHSMKDVPMDLPMGLGIPVICQREDPHDALITNTSANLSALPSGAVVGTASLRRACQLHAVRPDLTIKILRGNIDTRLKSLDNGLFDAIILAASGLKRLGLTQRISELLSLENFLPAVGQGALGIECRLADQEILECIQPLDNKETHVCVSTERAMNLRLNGGCQVPVAGHAVLQNQQLTLKGMVGSPDGKTILWAENSSTILATEQLGIQVANDLLAQGAGKILQTFKIHDDGFGV